MFQHLRHTAYTLCFYYTNDDCIYFTACNYCLNNCKENPNKIYAIIINIFPDIFLQYFLLNISNSILFINITILIMLISQFKISPDIFITANTNKNRLSTNMFFFLNSIIIFFSDSPSSFFHKYVSP